jgi:hypothetical protein
LQAGNITWSWNRSIMRLSGSQTEAGVSHCRHVEALRLQMVHQP